MATIKEVLLKAGVVEDEKARRVSNVSKKVAKITADEIENGVSIEHLEQVGVPVFKYTTQVTIHGKLPAFSESARPGGYKSIVKNRNGSVGVRYVAIDAEKKRLIVDASRANVEGRKYVASINSEGLQVAGFFQEKEDAIAAYKAFPRDLYVGGIQAGAGVFGGYYVIASVGAVYEANLWAFIDALWQIPSAERMAEVIAAKEAKYAEERAAAEVEREAARVAAAARAQDTAATLSAEIGLPKLGVVPKSGYCVRVSGNGAFVYFFKKKGPSLCYVARPYVKGAKVAGDFDGKMKRLDAQKLSFLQKSADAGLLFALNDNQA